MVQAPPRITWKQLVAMVLVAAFVAVFGFTQVVHAQGGALACARSSNRCDIDNGWLVHDRTHFPADQLQGAKVVWSHAPMRMYSSAARVYGIELVTPGSRYDLGGESDDHAAKTTIAANIDAFVKDPSAPTLAVDVAADAISRRGLAEQTCSNG